MSNIEINDIVVYSGKYFTVKSTNGGLLTLRKIFGKQYVVSVPSFLVDERSVRKIAVIKMFV